MSHKDAGVVMVAFRVATITVAILLAAMVLRNTVVAIGNDIRAPLGLSKQIWPADGTLELIDQKLIAPQIDWEKHTPDSVAQAARRARSLDPLDEWPFTLMGMIQLKSSDFKSAIESFKQAHRRNARAPTPHLLLLMAYSQDNKLDPAINDVITFINLHPQFSAPLLPLLQSAVAQKNSGDILRLLDRYPAVLALLVESVSRTNGAESTLPLLLSRPGITRKIKLGSIEALSQRGRHDLAYSTWTKLEQEKPPIPYDPHFQGLKGPQPYIWTVINGRDVNVDFARSSSNDEIALDVEAFGNTLNRVVYQIMPVPPGHHSLTISGTAVNPPAGSQSAKMRWTISCVDTNVVLSQIEFPMINGPQKRVMLFTIPQKGCDFQMLSLYVAPGEDRSEDRMRFNRVNLDMDSK